MLSNVIQILLVDDDLGDIRLASEALSESTIKCNIASVFDGEQALRYLNKEGEYADSPSPDLILLDLNMPRIDGREVLKAIKSEQKWRRIPVIILTTSDAEIDIVKAYELGANCYVRKPLDFKDFERVVEEISSFWFTIAKLPREK